MPALKKINLIFIEICNKCNFKCPHCYFFCHNQEKEISDQELDYCLPWFKYNCQGKQVIFTGGEPFLRKNAVEVFKKAKLEYELVVGVATNGSCLTKDMAESVRDYVDGICISYDGLTSYYTKEDYENIIRGINSCVKSKIPLDLHCTLTKENYTKIKEIIDDSISFGAKRIDFNIASDNTNSHIYEKSNKTRLVLNDSEISESYLELKDLMSKVEYDNFVITHHIVNKDNISDENFTERLMSPLWVIRGDASLYPMIDIPEKWKVSNKAYLDDIDIPKLNKFQNVLLKTLNQAKSRLASEDIYAINYFNILSKVLREENFQ